MPWKALAGRPGAGPAFPAAGKSLSGGFHEFRYVFPDSRWWQGFSFLVHEGHPLLDNLAQLGIAGNNEKSLVFRTDGNFRAL